MVGRGGDGAKVDGGLGEGSGGSEGRGGEGGGRGKGEVENVDSAAGSVGAKVTRDRMMLEIDKEFPMYGFKDHKGYGTKAHMAAIDKHGPCVYHRKTFAPIKHMDLSKWPECMKKKT